MKAGLNDYQNAERKDWVLTHFGQIVSVVSQIMWASSTEIYIQDNEKIPGSLQEWYDINLQQLAHLTEMVRGKLTPIHRKIVVALITADVHN